MITKQVRRDTNIHYLAETMSDTYSFIDSDADVLEDIKSHQEVLTQLIRQTQECCYFLAEYHSEGFCKPAIMLTSLVMCH